MIRRFLVLLMCLISLVESYYFKNGPTKCCPIGEAFNQTYECVFSAENFTVDLFDKTTLIYKDLQPFPIKHPFKNDCDSTYLTPEEYEADEFYLQRSGSLFLPNAVSDNLRFIKPEDFCLDRVTGDTRNIVKFCIKEDSDDENKIGMIISMPFLILSFIIYALSPEISLYRKCLMSYVICLFLGYLVLVTDVFIPLDETSCKIIGFSAIFFFMLSFLWMNVICIEIWSVFSDICIKKTKRLRFILYCLYVWGVSILYMVIVVVINESTEDAWFTPQIGATTCFLKEGYPELFYFYGPMGVIILFNVVLFVKTAAEIFKIRKDGVKLRAYRKQQADFKLYLNLLIGMGINWSFEFISWFTVWMFNVPHNIWRTTDLFNAAYGVFIFIITVLKVENWTMIKRRYYSLTGKSSPTNSHASAILNTRASILLSKV